MISFLQTLCFALRFHDVRVTTFDMLVPHYSALSLHGHFSGYLFGLTILFCWMVVAHAADQWTN